jgi:S-DNA-T family DNA segregation ATPase FtsK/SpoIIIE
MPAPPIFWRSPRLKQALPRAEVEIPPPPATPSPPSALLPILLPIGLMAAVMIPVGLLSGAGTMLLLSLPMILVGGVAAFFTRQTQQREYERKTAARQEKYTALLERYSRTLAAYRQEQQDKLLQQYPDPQQCLGRAAHLERDLWARSPEDDDFLCVRLGLVDRDRSPGIPSTVKVKPPQTQDVLEPDPLVTRAQDLADRFAYVPAAPVWCSLRPVGGVGLTGERPQVWNLARSVALQLATHHSPDEVRLVAVYPERDEAQWGWLAWLPHVWSDDRRQRFLARDREGSHALLAAMNQLLNQRKNLLQEQRSRETPAWPFHLVFFIDLSAAELTENEPLVQRLQAEGPGLGAYPVFLAERVRELPRNCRTTISLRSGETFVSWLDANASTHFVSDEAPPALAERFAAALAPVRLKKPASVADIPASLTLLDLLGARTVEELKIAERWRSSAKTGRSLAATIGMRGGGEPLILDLHERQHGPNGLVAGMVGAGKSELLQTLVASLAVNYHPHRVAFVLVDYKGGGMTDPFVKLPHTLGVITNLQQGNLAVRALTSFNVEAQRRQRLLADAGVNHIDDYQRLYYQGRAKEPLPYLVIIVDEFAEMKTEQPDVAKEFVRIARIGRALGFRLILAMQKPAGIVDGQIEANTRFRLCLRVAQTEDSQAMLKRPDAAYLGGVGRAYFQVGANEVYELFQVAWSGAPYDPVGLEADDPLQITEIGLDGSHTTLYRPPRPRRSSAAADETQLRVLVEHLHEVAAAEGIKSLERPWLDPLPEHVALDEIVTDGGWDGQNWQPVERWLEPVVGLVDDPRQRYQGPLRVNLGREGHLIVYAAPGYGATTLVQTLASSLARTYSPADVHLYLLDFGGRLLRLFEPLPHVGAVITADEMERFDRLLRYLLQELERRKECFGQAGVATLPDYRATAGQTLPAIVVMLDNFFPEFAKDRETAVNAIAQLAREGGSLGIHLVISAAKTTDITYRVSGNITAAVALRLAEASEYSAIVGRAEGPLPAAIPGRGLVKALPPLEFQAALPARGQTDAERSVALRVLFQQMAAARPASHPRPAPIKTLPPVVTLAELLTPGDRWCPPAPADGGALAVPLGLDVANLTPFSVDLAAGPHFLIAGPVQSGKSSLLQTWLLALAERLPPNRLQLWLLDSRRVGLAPLEGLPHVMAYAADTGQADAALASLLRLLQERQGAFEEARRKTRGAFDPTELLGGWPTVVIAADDLFDQADDVTSEDAKEKLAQIVRQGRRLGLHLLAAGSSSDLASKGWSEPVKALKEAPTGFMLGISDDSVFNLRLPYEERDKHLPSGQAYWTQRGQSRKVQLATAQAGAPALPAWVKRLAERRNDR